MNQTTKALSFDQVADRLLGERGVTLSPSELQGALIGSVSAGQRLDAVQLPLYLAKLLDLDSFSRPETEADLSQVYQACVEQLESDQFELTLLLPDDDESIESRAEQLGLWVSGFLAGFGEAIALKTQALSPEANEALQDLIQIAQVEADQQDEESERLLIEVEEYVRMAAMMLFAECNRTKQQRIPDSSHQSSTAH